MSLLSGLLGSHYATYTPIPSRITTHPQTTSLAGIGLASSRELRRRQLGEVLAGGRFGANSEAGYLEADDEAAFWVERSWLL